MPSVSSVFSCVKWPLSRIIKIIILGKQEAYTSQFSRCSDRASERRSPRRRVFSFDAHQQPRRRPLYLSILYLLHHHHRRRHPYPRRRRTASAPSVTGVSFGAASARSALVHIASPSPISCFDIAARFHTLPFVSLASLYILHPIQLHHNSVCAA